MRERPENQDEERLNFPRGWKGLYIFLFFYGVLQIILLLVFTGIFNRP